MKQILIFLLCFSSSTALSCECQLFTKGSIALLKKSVDYVVFGTVVDQINVENNSTLDSNWKNNRWATEIVLQVNEVIKGNMVPKLVYITQYDKGNCATGFVKGEQYIIAGHRVDEFINLTPNLQHNIDSKIQDTVVSLPIKRVKLIDDKYHVSRFLNNKFFD